MMKKTNIRASHRVTLLAVCIIPAVIALVFIKVYAYNIPNWDSWEFIPLLEKVYAHKKVSLSDLTAQHNEHRILFPRLIMLCLSYFSAWDSRCEIWFSFSLLCISFYVFCSQVDKLYEFKSMNTNFNYVFIGTCLIISFIIFSVTQYENMLWGWQMQIFLNILAVLLGLFFLTNFVVIGIQSVLLAAVCGIIATYSFANGLLFWPIAGLVLFVRSRQVSNNKYLLVVWLIITLLVVALYMHGYTKPSGHPPLTYILHNPYSYLLYILYYLGSPIVELKVAQLIPIALGGVIGLLCIPVISYSLFKLKIFWERHVIFWHGLLLYALLSGVITALGRAGFGRGQALASRYITICNFFWLWIIVLGFYVFVKLKFFNLRIFAIICIFFTLLFVYYDVAWFKIERLSYTHMQQAQLALESDSMSSKALYYVYPQPENIIMRNSFLKKNHLSFYSK